MGKGDKAGVFIKQVGDGFGSDVAIGLGLGYTEFDALLTQVHPGEQVGVVLKEGYNDIITGLPGVGKGKQIESGGCPLTEDQHMPRGQVDVAGKILPCFGNLIGGFDGSSVGGAPHGRPLVAVVFANGVGDYLRREGSGSGIQIDAEGLFKDGELGTELPDIKGAGHQYSLAKLGELLPQ